MAQTNREFSGNNRQFIDACIAAGLPQKPAIHKRGAKTVTAAVNNLTRQASKFRRGKGIVYKTLIDKK